MVRAADMLLEAPGFKSRLGHYFSMVLSSLSDSWHYPCSVRNVQEIAAPSDICWANEELEYPVEKKTKCIGVINLSFWPMAHNLLKVGWANGRVLNYKVW